MRFLKTVALLASLTLCACGTLQGRALLPPQPDIGPRTTIFVIRRGWHTDIGLATADVQPALADVRAASPAAPYILFGFGDRHYLMHHGRRFGALLGALWPGPGVVLVTTLQAPPQAAFGKGKVIPLRLGAEQLRRLEAFVRDAISGPAGSPEELGPGPYEGSAYFASPTRYSGLHTCNTWTAEGLALAGLAVHSHGVEFSGQIWHQVQRLALRSHTTAAGTAQPLALSP